MVRYQRQVSLPEITALGQERLSEASVLILGVGGLGCPAAQYLVGAGVGRVGVVDDDVVSMSNLHRQVLYRTDEVGQKKVPLAVKRLHELNPEVILEGYEERLVEDNASALIDRYDLVLDCTDNFRSRYAINQASVELDRPLVSASLFQFEGRVAVFNYRGGACYRCLYPNIPSLEYVPNCSDTGVLGAATGVLGSLQAMEAIKIITGAGEVMSSKMAVIDFLTGHFQVLKLSRRKNCPACRGYRLYQSAEGPELSRRHPALTSAHEDCGLGI